METSKFISDLLADDTMLYRIDVLGRMGFETHMNDVKDDVKDVDDPTVVLPWNLPTNYKIDIRLSHGNKKIPMINSNSCIVDKESAIETFKKMFRLAMQLHAKTIAYF